MAVCDWRIFAAHRGLDFDDLHCIEILAGADSNHGGTRIHEVTNALRWMPFILRWVRLSPDW